MAATRGASTAANATAGHLGGRLRRRLGRARPRWLLLRDVTDRFIQERIPRQIGLLALEDHEHERAADRHRIQGAVSTERNAAELLDGDQLTPREVLVDVVRLA